MLFRRTRETAGSVIGGFIAPAFAAGSHARRARVFHPMGTVFEAAVTPLTQDGTPGMVARSLAGHAVVRFSGGIWKAEDRWPDLLGCAIRFCPPERVLAPSRLDQDLVFATLRFPWTLGLALFSTRASDFFSNVYFGASPFLMEGQGVVKLRLRAEGPTPEGRNRTERLMSAVKAGTAIARIEFKSHLLPAPWRPLATIQLLAAAREELGQLRFNPFLDGRGLRPVGFVQALRKPAYRVSQQGWPRHGEGAPVTAAPAT